MSKQSEAKKLQGYRTDPACCKNCKHYRSEMVEIPSSHWGYARTVEKNKRCAIGGFAVQSTAHCTAFAWAIGASE